MTGDFERSGDGEETGFRGLGEEKGKGWCCDVAQLVGSTSFISQNLTSV